MATMQRQFQSSLVSDGDCAFDMWHDYMNLGRLLERLCDRREGDHGDTESPKSDRAAGEGGPWRHIQSTRRGERKNSVETVSDASSTGTSADFCRFCKQNGETAMVYRSHKLKSSDGKVVCPILRNYTCPICEATGDRAHTRRYCPKAERHGEAAKRHSRLW